MAETAQKVSGHVALPVAEMTRLLKASGRPTTAAELRLDENFYYQAVCHVHEKRNRFSFVDIASHTEILHDFSRA